MKCPVHIVFTMTRNIYTKAITEVTMLNCFATLPQAKASLQYEYDISVNENCDPLDETDRPVWLNEDHTELKLAPGYDPSYETIVYIDSSVHFYDASEPCFKYGEKHTEQTVEIKPFCGEENSEEAVDALHGKTNFRLLDSVCFNHKMSHGWEVIRGRLAGVAVPNYYDDATLLIATVDRMVIESTGESFDHVSVRMHIPVTELYHNPTDAIEALSRKHGC